MIPFSFGRHVEFSIFGGVPLIDSITCSEPFCGVKVGEKAPENRPFLSQKEAGVSSNHPNKNQVGSVSFKECI